MAKLEVYNLNKTYGPKIVPVKDMSFRVEDGEFLTLVGPSGCGKSTTLRMVAGLEQPTHGRVVIGEKDVTSVSAGDRNIAMVFQSYALYPHMSVYENMASGLKLRDMSKSDIDERIVEATRVLGLDGLLNRKPAKLSGGQRQRVALGRALVRHPDVFLLDEPLSNLDALLREQVRADLKQIFEAQSTPVVYVTHDQTEAMTLSTKVAVLYEGNIQQIDSPSQVYTRPANRFVAGFIGSPQMNLLTLNCDGNAAILGDTRLILPDRFVPPPEIVLGVRPENISIATPEDTETIDGKVFLVENLGMSNLLSVQVKNSDITLRVLLPSDQNWSETITLALPVRRRHWFNVQTGERLPDAVSTEQQRMNAKAR
jgi:multiple sugar transport system ATP-binding protein